MRKNSKKMSKKYMKTLSNQVRVRVRLGQAYAANFTETEKKHTPKTCFNGKQITI